MTTEEVLGRLRKLRPRSAPGPDGVFPVMLKRGGEHLARLLARTCSLCLAEGYHPPEWRHGLVRPLFKGKGQRSDPGCYRPVSVTNAVGRVFEGLMADRLSLWLESRGWLTDDQEGFRRGRGCLTTLTYLTEQWWHRTDKATAYPNEPVVSVVCTDLAKAFDRIDRELLLYKLHHGAGITGRTLTWLASLLGPTRQQVRLPDGTTSPALMNDRGVPQGCCLSPLLFLCWINDLGADLDCHVNLFADDAVLWSDAPTAEGQQVELRTDLRRFADWCETWGVEVQPAKCAHLELRRAGARTRGALECAGTVIPRQSEYKLLGMWISQDLKWDLHIQRRCIAPLRRQRGFIGWLSRGAGTAQRSVATRVYTGVLRPRVEYGSALYGCQATSQNLLRQLERLQTELVASILGLKAGSAAHAAILAEAGVESLRSRRRWTRLRLLSRVAELPTTHRLRRLWRTRIDDSGPSRYFRDAHADLRDMASKPVLADFGTPRFRATLRRERLRVADAAFTRLNTASATKLREVKPTTAPWPHTMLGARRECVLATRLRLGVAPLSARRHRLGLEDSPNCRHCGGALGGPPETREHFLLECAGWLNVDGDDGDDGGIGPRDRLEAELMRVGVPCPTDVRTLLGGGDHPPAVKRAVASALHQFLRETGRFKRAPHKPLNPDAPEWFPPGPNGDAPGADSDASSGGGDSDEKRDVKDGPGGGADDGSGGGGSRAPGPAAHDAPGSSAAIASWARSPASSGRMGSPRCALTLDHDGTRA